MDTVVGTGWTGWYKVMDGDGSITISGDVFTSSSGIATGRARLSRWVYLQPGEVLEVSCLGRRDSGADATSGGLFIDFPTEGAMADSIRFVSAHWQEHTLIYAAPITATSGQYATISIGQITSSGGQVQAAAPRIRVTQSAWGAPRVIGMGMISLASGNATIAEAYQDAGIFAVSYSAGTSTLSITFKGGIPYYMIPIFFAQICNDAGTNALRLIPKPGVIHQTTGVLPVQFVDCTTGAVVNIATYGTFKLQILGVM